MKEYRDLTSDPINDTLMAGPVSEDNMLEWEALIQGPDGTPYVSVPGCFVVYTMEAELIIAGGWCLCCQAALCG
jgi:hypothetical protein